MKKVAKTKSWLDEKLKNPKFRKKFDEEFEKLSIGEQLVRLRLQSGLTQAQVAKRVGTTASAISRYENAEYDRYEIQTLRKIVEACGGEFQVVVKGPEDKGRVA
jgi:predicted XRE-type DNA-binding protein